MNQKSSQLFEREYKDNSTELLVAVTLMFLIMPLFAIYAGWVASTLWTWFVVPLGLPQISIAHALGLDLLLTYIVYRSHNYVEKVRTHPLWIKLISMAFNSFGIASYFLVVGYIVNHFV